VSLLRSEDHMVLRHLEANSLNVGKESAMETRRMDARSGNGGFLCTYVLRREKMSHRGRIGTKKAYIASSRAFSSTSKS